MPKRVPRALWTSLREYGLARTPVEHARYLLSNATESNYQHTVYSESFNRVLGAILKMDPHTKHLKIVYKSGTGIDSDLLIEGSKMLINDRWLDFEKSHVASFCSVSEVTGCKSNFEFSCDHIITHLHESILLETIKEEKTSSLVQHTQMMALRLKVHRALRQLPRLVKVEKTALPRQLIVSWRDLESQIMFEEHGSNLVCHVTLHRESTCAERKRNLVGPTSQSGI